MKLQILTNDKNKARQQQVMRHIDVICHRQAEVFAGLKSGKEVKYVFGNMMN
jgi:hypothetical protein